MKVIFGGDKIKIRRGEGVIFVLDRDGGIQELYEIVKSQARELDVPFKLGALSCKDELTEDDIEVLNQKMQNRGRFIAPLVEGFFQQLPIKEYDIIILHSGCIYDLKDYSRELSSRFNRIIPLKPGRNMFNKEVFDFSVGSVSVSLLSPAVPYEWDSDFTLSLDIAKKQFVLKRVAGEKAKKIDINLMIRSKSDTTNIELEVNGSRFEGILKNDKTFIAPQWKSLSDKDIGIFKEHLKIYEQSTYDIQCPLCFKAHEFKEPFLCKNKRARLSEGTTILESIRTYQSGFILFFCKNNEVMFLQSEKETSEFEELRFVFVSRDEGRVYGVKCKDISLEIKEAVKLYKNLYELEKDRLYVLVLGL